MSRSNGPIVYRLGHKLFKLGSRVRLPVGSQIEKMIILGIETSCDETAISILKAKGELDSLEFEILGSAVNSQIDIHKEYGGVFPTIAKREHIKNLLPVLIESLRKAGLISNSQFPISKQFSNLEEFLNEKPQLDIINLIAVTIGPGLEPALWTGINFAKELGEKLNIPVIGANHMLGHITSVLFKTDEISNKKIKFPALALLISGGHTELILLKNWQEKKKLGETQDDAVGEAFDKVARMLDLPYPGGPEISRLAMQARELGIMNNELRLPRPMIHSKDLNFSFSGLKTAVLYYVKKLEKLGEKEKMEIAREFEDAVIETLLSKTKKAIEEYLPQTLIIGGGVIANKALRENFMNLKNNFPHLEILIPEKNLTTDNATMIAVAGYIESLSNKTNFHDLSANGNLEIT